MDDEKIVDEAFEEGTFAFSNRIVALIDDDLEVELDPEIEAILATENL